MQYTIREVGDADKGQVVDVFNYYVRNSFAAYPDREVGLEFFDMLRGLSKGFPVLVITVEQRVIGFGLLRQYHPSQTFRHTGLLTYFIVPEHTGQGLGSELLNRLEQEAKARGMRYLLAHVSSRNEQSLSFHERHGFVECGRMRGIGLKFDQPFDVVWVQKSL